MRNRTRYTILGMLSIKPQTGYDIIKMIKLSTSYFWSESEGQIYPELAKCVADGLATCEESSLASTNRNKKNYSITKLGHEVLATWLESAPQKTLVRNELLLKLFFAENTAPAVTIEHLRDFQNNTVTQREILEQIYQEELESAHLSPHAKFWLLTLEYGIELAKAQSKWSKKAIHELELLNKD